MQREGLTIPPNLENSFTLGTDPEEELLSVIDAVCDAIGETLNEGGAVLVLDIGGGIAALAAHSKYGIKVAQIDSRALTNSP